MINLREKLSAIITSKPDAIQFAKDRKFEEAWIINLNHKRPIQQEIHSYLTKEKFGTLIVEYVWNQKNDDNRFVITIFLDKNCRLQDPKKFIDICLNNFYQFSNFEDLINNFNRDVVGYSYLLNNQTESVNLSVFNHWLSVGPVDLWKVGETYSSKLIADKIKSRPEIEKTKLNYQGLFFRFNVSKNLNGPYYGIKTPCCHKINDEWIIDYKKVDYWMKTMLNL